MYSEVESGSWDCKAKARHGAVKNRLLGSEMLNSVISLRLHLYHALRHLYDPDQYARLHATAQKRFPSPPPPLLAVMP